MPFLLITDFISDIFYHYQIVVFQPEGTKDIVSSVRDLRLEWVQVRKVSPDEDAPYEQVLASELLTTNADAQILYQSVLILICNFCIELVLLKA